MENRMSDFIDELNTEIDRRIAVMEDPKYENVPPFEKRDFMPPALLFAASLLFLIISYFKV